MMIMMKMKVQTKSKRKAALLQKPPNVCIPSVSSASISFTGNVICCTLIGPGYNYTSPKEGRIPKKKKRKKKEHREDAVSVPSPNEIKHNLLATLS